MWKLRRYLIEKLVGRQTVVLNVTLICRTEDFETKDLDLLVNGSMSTYWIDNVTIRNSDGKKEEIL